MLTQWYYVSLFIFDAFSAFFDGLLTPVTLAEVAFELFTFGLPVSDIVWYEFEALVIDFLSAGSWSSFFGLAGPAVDIFYNLIFEFEFYPMLLISPVVLFAAIAVKVWRLFLDLIPIL